MGNSELCDLVGNNEHIEIEVPIEAPLAASGAGAPAVPSAFEVRRQKRIAENKQAMLMFIPLSDRVDLSPSSPLPKKRKKPAVPLEKRSRSGRISGKADASRSSANSSSSSSESEADSAESD